MNWIDLLLITVILLAVWTGWQRGFINGTVGFLIWAGSFIAAYLAYPFVTHLIETITHKPGGWSRPVAFISLVIATRMLLNFAGTVILEQTSGEAHQHALNKLLGLLPGFANGCIQAVVLAGLLLTIPVQNKVSEQARESPLAHALAPPAFWLAHTLSPVFSDPLRNAFPGSNIHSEKEFISLPYKVTHARVRADLETAMLLLVNEERKKAGLKPLKADPELQVVARAHSKDMFARGYFAHLDPDGNDPFERMHKNGVRFLTAGENLALAQTVSQAHDGLMNSPGHRANILQRQFGRIGIGIMDGGIYGIMVTQNFRN